MPVDPQIQALLDKGTGVPATHTLPVAEARRLYEARIAVMAPGAEVAKVAQQRIDGPGGPIELRIYTPVGTGPFPLMVFFHGSGFVLCSLDTHDGMCRNLCAGAGCVVASVDYRLAPEHKFPAGPDDCLLATRWAAAHAAELGADPARIAIAGDSAGATMAAVTALRLRDEGGPVLCGQLLLYPVTDYYTRRVLIRTRRRSALRCCRICRRRWSSRPNTTRCATRASSMPRTCGPPASRLHCRAMTVSTTGSCSGSVLSTRPARR
jgi:acetyl esterase